ncbi:MAG: electron transport complex subunit RsxC [Clostridia bacterium]|nr:electron transport complex subunit RsxC [Clostridia bacterium]
MKYIAEEILKPVKNIAGGINLPHFKNTADSVATPLPDPKTVVMPLKQHIGAALEPTVAVTDKVFVGTLIADSESPMSAPLHSSVSGTVKEITEVKMPSGEKVKAIVIESDGSATQAEPNIPTINSAEDIVKAARNAGLVGLGGAGFPTHIKLAPAVNDNIDTLIINAAECEPYITSDYRTCMDDYDDVFDGIYLLKKYFNFKNIIIAVEADKPLAIRKLCDIASDRQDTINAVKVMKLKKTYPQGAEKFLVYTTTGKMIPPGKLPSDVGCVVMNITSIAALNRYIRTGMPLVSKRITVDGNGITNPQNLIVPIGTPIINVLEFCGYNENLTKILYGGPMMGLAVSDITSPVLKQNNAILALCENQNVKSTPCIKCGRCLRHCPVNLTPAFVNAALKRQDNEKLAVLNINQCIECGSCAYVCPASIPLTQVMRTAKSILRRNSNVK